MKWIKTILFGLMASLLHTEAFPYEAGHCSSGSLAERNSVHGNFGGGDPIGQGGFTITIGDISPSIDSALELNAGLEYPVKIERTNGSFRGLLFRLPGAGVFSVPSSDGFKLHSRCSADVSAVTHSDNNDKSLVEFTLKYESVGEASLDVTTLITKNDGDWFYSSYLLNFV